MNTFKNDVQMNVGLSVNGNTSFGTNESQTITCNSPIKSSTSAKLGYVGIGTMEPSTSNNDLLRVGANLLDDEKCGIQIGKDATSFNCGYIHFYHVSDNNTKIFYHFLLIQKIIYLKCYPPVNV